MRARKIGIQAIYPDPLTIFLARSTGPPLPATGGENHASKSGVEPNITDIRLNRGFMYLTAIIDWFCSRILARRLSSTPSSDFCVKVL